MAGIILCFTSWIFSGIGFVIHGFYTDNTLLLLLYGLAYITGVSGYTSFKASIVQYNIDQLVGASADELSAVIYWHSASVPISFSIFQLVRCAIRNDYIFLITFVSAGLSLFLVVVSHSFFKHKLENISLIKNPVKLIVKVLCYARKHKYPENRSALTYWEEEAPSRLDLGKDRYGGPFTEEEVEDVKTVFRMLPLLISVVGLTTNDEVYHWIMSRNQNIEMSYGSCLISTEFANFFTSVIFFLFYLLLFQPIFKRLVPRMLIRIRIGLVFSFGTVFAKTAIFLSLPSDHSDSTSLFLIIPQFFFGIAFALIFAASLEFTVAQAPVQMRGMMVGMWLASMGVGYLININLKYVFQCKNEFMCTNPFYYAVKSAITLVFFSLFCCLSKRYKFLCKRK
uniref:Major facilitator superfamily (MFS) profile domain-containing protein n=1 Tax=Amphimedon queenslandica TaxID=400682 RepID=A0A1X7U391_AMPQE